MPTTSSNQYHPKNEPIVGCQTVKINRPQIKSGQQINHAMPQINEADNEDRDEFDGQGY